jgi:hypothetical protein
LLEVEQEEKGGKPQRNDRFLLAPVSDKTVEADILTDRLKEELENFFRGAVLGTGKTLAILAWRGPDAALRAIKAGMA